MKIDLMVNALIKAVTHNNSLSFSCKLFHRKNTIVLEGSDIINNKLYEFLIKRCEAANHGNSISIQKKALGTIRKYEKMLIIKAIMSFLQDEFGQSATIKLVHKSDNIPAPTPRYYFSGQMTAGKGIYYDTIVDITLEMDEMLFRLKYQ